MLKEFYMVYVQGANTPSREHATLEDAEKEAKRLAELTGKKAFVLGTIKSFEVNKFVEKNCSVGELPF